MCEKRKVRLLSLIGGLLMLFSFSQSWAEGCAQSAPAADTVALIDATTGCASISGQTGCRIDNGEGTCTATDSSGNVLFTANASKDSSGYVNWNLNSGAAHKIDSTLLGGATQGNACGYFHQYDTDNGNGLGFEKSRGGLANITYLDICTDLKDEAAPRPAKILPACPADIQQALNDQTIPADFAIVGTISDGDSVTMCIRQDPNLIVTPCVNEETSTGGDSPRCADGPDVTGNGIPDGQLPLIRDITFTASKAGNNSAVYYCLPPTITFDGVNSCAWLYY